MSENTTISVVKSAAIETYDAPAVVYELACDAETPKTVRLSEPIPDGFEPADLGFHQNYHASEWWVGDSEIVFEYPLEPGETVTTIVGVRTSSASDLDRFFGEPTIELGTTDQDDQQCWGEISDSLVDVQIDADATGDLAATDGGETPLASETVDDGEQSPEDTQSSEADQPTHPGDEDRIEAAIPSVGTSGDDERPEPEVAAVPDEEALVDQFVDELASESLSESQRRRLREALGVDGITSMDARIEHCQQRLADLSAYVDALEAFLDEEGSGQELITDFRDDVAAVESHLASLETDLDETASGQDDLRERVDEIEDEMASLRSLREDVGAMESQFDEATTEIRSEVESLSTTVERLREWQRGVTAAFEDLQSVDS